MSISGLEILVHLFQEFKVVCCKIAISTNDFGSSKLRLHLKEAASMKRLQQPNILEPNTEFSRFPFL